MKPLPCRQLKLASMRIPHLCISAFAVALGLAVGWWMFRPEPTFQGRSIRSWLGEIQDITYTRPLPQEMIATFRQNASIVVPGLVQIIEIRNPALHRLSQSPRLLGRPLPSAFQDWINQRFYRELWDRAYAIELCSTIGPEAKGAHAVLIRTCSDPYWGIRRSAVKSLVKTEVPPKTAVPILSQISLKDPVYEVQEEAAKCLGLLGEKAKSAVPALRMAATNGHPAVKWSARWALERIENRKSL